VKRRIGLRRCERKKSDGAEIAENELKIAAGDLVLLLGIRPGTSQGVSNIEIWKVDEARVKELGKPIDNPIQSSEGTIYRFGN
jgi:hypothetical protein